MSASAEATVEEESHNDGDAEDSASATSSCHRRTASTAPPPPPNRRGVAVALYLVTTALLFADQNLLAPNLSAAATEFGFDALERDRKLGGEIALAFFLVGAPASFVVGCLADGASGRRSALFALTVLVGEGACMATYYTTTYSALFWCRALTGCSVGGALPLVYSVLGDFYSPSERGAASAVIGMGTGIGIAFGQGLAGFLGPRYGWRMPFLVVSIPAMVFAVLVWVCVPEPERGGMDKLALRCRRRRRGRSGATTVSRSEHIADACGEMAIEMSISGSSAIDKEINDWNEQELGSSQKENGRGIIDGNVQTKNFLSNSGNSDGDRDSSSEECCDVKFPRQDPPENFTSPATTQYPLSSARERDGGCRSRLRAWYKESVRPHVRNTRSLLRCQSVLLAVFQGAPGCVPWGIVNTYLNDYLSTNRGMSVEGATTTILFFGFGNFLGMFVGGIGSTRLYSIDPRYPNVLSGVAAILGCFPMWMLINAVDASSPPWFAVSISLAAGIGSGVTGPIVKATLQNVTMPRTRGQAFALLNTFDDVGRGLGPALVAVLIAKMGGRREAFNVGVAGWVLCGLLNLALFNTTGRDEERVQALLHLSTEEEWGQPWDCRSIHDGNSTGHVLLRDKIPPSSPISPKGSGEHYFPEYMLVAEENPILSPKSLHGSARLSLELI